MIASLGVVGVQRVATLFFMLPVFALGLFQR